MTTVVVPPLPVKEASKPVKGGLFVLFWLIALALWIIAPNIADPRWGAYAIDSGIVFASIGFAALQITGATALRNTLLLGFLLLGVFALGDFLEITVLSFFLRMFVPLVALLAALYAGVGKVKVWYS
ncbi:MAG: hypothetical protein Q7T71_11935 [Herbiconiux sp.]|nr:hypothetical protein [Herbiconiux sp.]